MGTNCCHATGPCAAFDINAINAYTEDVAALNIRNLPEEVHRALRIRAARAGRSMEAEAREILAAAVRSEQASLPSSTLQDFVDELYGGDPPVGVVESLLAERRREAALE